MKTRSFAHITGEGEKHHFALSQGNGPVVSQQGEG